MADNNVGQVELDLLLNSKGFRNQLEGAVNKAVSKTSSSISGKVTSTFGKMGKLALAAFSVKAVAGFVKETTNLGSELEEVENVANVTFKSLNRHLDIFAKKAIRTYGMSETMTKKYVGTMGAMAKSFGFTEKQAYVMGTTLSGLVGDVASFYNLDHDTAYNKLKAVFTGETEGLKDLGVVMTQTALDEYAMQKGLGKTTAAMSEQEKVFLRYNFVLDKLKGASGDFIRTQDGWANQLRILSLQWSSFKANLGQGFIAILKPALKFLNAILERLVQITAYFKVFIDYFFNNEKTENSAVGQIADDAQKAEENIGNTTQAVKKMKRTLLGIDQLHILPDKEEAPDVSGMTGGFGDFGDFNVPDTDIFDESIGQMENFLGFVKKAEERTNAIITKMKTKWKEFWDKAIPPETRENWKKSLTELWETFKEVMEPSIKKWQGIIKNFKEIFSGIGEGINFEGLFGKLGELFIKPLEDAENQASFLDGLFTAVVLIVDLFGQIGETITDIFGGENSSIITNFINGMISGFGKVVDVITKANLTIGAAFTDIIEGGTLDSLREDIVETVENIAGSLSIMFDKWLKPGLSDFMKWMRNTVLPNFDKFVALVHDAIIALSGAIGAVLAKGTKLIMAFIDWISPAVREVFLFIVSTVETLAEILGGMLNGVIQLFTGFFNFIEHLFEGDIDALYDDLDKMWEGIKNFFTSLFGKMIESLKEIGSWIGEWLTVLWGKIKEFFMGIPVIKAFVDFVAGIIKTVKGFCSMLSNLFKGEWKFLGASLGDFLDGIIQTAIAWKDIFFETIGKGIKTLWDMFVSFVDAWKTGVHVIWLNIKEFFKKAFEWVVEKFVNLYNKIVEVGDWIIDKFRAIKDNVLGFFRGMKDGIVNIFEGIVNTLKRPINSIISLVNGMIDGINSISIDVPSGIPKYGGKKFGFNIPNIPYLAQGGYVGANQPKLAVIGDNRHEGEVVAPESKLVAAAAQANAPLLQALLQNNALLMQLLTKNTNGDITIPVYLGGELLDQFIVNANDRDIINRGGY